MFQDGVARDGPVRIETCGLPFLFLREKEEVEPTGDEHGRDAGTDVRADGRSFFAGDSAPVHQIAINAIESEIGHVRHLFFSTGRGVIYGQSGDDLPEGRHSTVTKICIAKPNRFVIMSITKLVPGTLQEGGASFETTHWTVVLRAQQSESAESAQQALSTFCEAYWPPLYAFLRHRGHSSADDD